LSGDRLSFSTPTDDLVIITPMSVTRVHRLVRLITVLRSGRRYGADALAEEMEVSRRTIFRDLKALAEAGVPYYYDQSTEGYAIDRSFFLPAINFTLDEGLALLLATRKMIGQLPMPLFQQVSFAAMKVESNLPRALQEHCGSIMDRFEFRWPAVAEDHTLDERFHQLRIAIEQQRKVVMLYESLYDAGNRTPLGKTIETVVSPYRVIFIHRAWYLIGHSAFHSQVRTFKLSRITELKILEEMFADPEFSLENYLGDAWVMIPEGRKYNVELVFSPKVSRNVAEVHWHRTQSCEFLDDGSLRFRVTVDGLNEISWWIMGYGDQVKVVRPAQLKKMIIKAAENVVKSYRSSDASDSSES